MGLKMARIKKIISLKSRRSLYNIYYKILHFTLFHSFSLSPLCEDILIKLTLTNALYVQNL